MESFEVHEKKTCRVHINYTYDVYGQYGGIHLVTIGTKWKAPRLKSVNADIIKHQSASKATSLHNYTIGLTSFQ